MKSLLLIILFALAASADGTGTHGGGGILTLKNGEPVTLELLDFWEAAHDKDERANIIYSEEPVEKQIANAIDKLTKLSPVFGKEVQAAYDHMLMPGVVIPPPPGKTLPPPPDTNLSLLDEYTHLIGIAKYDDDKDELMRDDKVFAKLKTLTDKAGLGVHEAVYKVLRKFNLAKDSVGARRVVRYAFSDQKRDGVYASVPAGSYHCTQTGSTAKAFDAFLYLDKNKATLFVGQVEGAIFLLPTEMSVTSPAFNYFSKYYGKTITDPKDATLLKGKSFAKSASQVIDDKINGKIKLTTSLTMKFAETAELQQRGTSVSLSVEGSNETKFSNFDCEK